MIAKKNALQYNIKKEIEKLIMPKRFIHRIKNTRDKIHRMHKKPKKFGKGTILTLS